MPESHASRGSRRGRRLLIEIGAEIREARRSAGLTLAAVAAAAGISGAELSRVERGLAPWLDVLTAARICAVVGLDLWMRAYPGADPLRDAGHASLFEAFGRLLGAGLLLRGEVTIGDVRDQRGWDGTIARGSDAAGVELETRLTDSQALVRRINLKRRDSGVDRVILVFADTRSNRIAFRAAETLLRTEFPLDDAAVRAALAAGRVPEASGILFLRVERRDPAPMPRAGLRPT